MACAALRRAIASAACVATLVLTPARAYGPNVLAQPVAFDVPPTAADFATGPGCRVSDDGFLWYVVPAGPFPPIDFRHVFCPGRSALSANGAPPVPQWAAPPKRTRAIFVATSLQEYYSGTGMSAIEYEAARAGVPVTWMVGDFRYLNPTAIAFYDDDHAVNGDDVEVEPHADFYKLAKTMPWFRPAVSVEGAGRERDMTKLRKLGDDAFWGITWNSHDTDGTSDEGAPWGTYCADPTSYKRPAPDGSCAIVAFEWTARDLTRAFFQNTSSSHYSSEAAYSTDPDDVLARGGFDVVSAERYERRLIDAYAAAGADRPIAVVVNQESADEEAAGPVDDPILRAIYEEARRTGMRAMTLRSADRAAHAFSAAPRAVAFPYLSGGHDASFDGAPFATATIDYHDRAAGMTFVAGHTLPARLFEYADARRSRFTQTLPSVVPGDARYPELLGVAASRGALRFDFRAPRRMRFGVAVWSDPGALGVRGSAVVTAGRAGFVAAFDLPAGRSTQTVPCGCNAAAFVYSR